MPLPGSGFTGFSGLTTASEEPLGTSPGPLARTRPQTLSSFERKWRPAVPVLEARGIPREVWAPVMEIDLQRASSGQNVLSANETILALRSAQTGNAVQQHPQGNILERGLRDIRQTVSALPQLPIMVAKEIPAALTEAPGQIAEGLADIGQGDVKEGVATITDAPGVRMLPGAFTAHNLATGQSLTEHPVFTLLDLLPYASKGVGAIPKVAEASEALRQAGEFGKARPLRTAMREYVTKPHIARVEAKTGVPYTGLLTKLGVSGTHQGEIARQVSIAGRYGDDLMREFADEIPKIAQKYKIDPGRQPIIHEAATTGRRGMLSPAENAYVDALSAYMDKRLTQEAKNQGGIVEIDGEFYDAKSRLPAAIRKYDKTIAAKEKGIAKLRDVVEGIGQGKANVERILSRNPLYDMGEFKTADGRVASVTPEEIVNSWAEHQGLDVRGVEAARVMYDTLGPDQTLWMMEKIHDDFLDQSLKDVYGGDIDVEIAQAGEKVVVKGKAAEPGLDVSAVNWADQNNPTRVAVEAMQGYGPLNDILEARTGLRTPLKVSEAEDVLVAPGMKDGAPTHTPSDYFIQNFDLLKASLTDAIDGLPKDAFSDIGWTIPQAKSRLLAGLDQIKKTGQYGKQANVMEKMRNTVYRNAKTPAKSISRAISRGRYGEAAKWATKLADRLDALADETGITEVAIEATKWRNRAYELENASQFLSVRKTWREKAKNLPINRERLSEFTQARDEALSRRTELLESNPPARYEPLVREEALRQLKAKVQGDEKIRARLIKAGNDPDAVDWADVTIRMEEGLPISIPGLSSREINATIKEARATWMEMKANGVPPVFVHALDLDQVQALNRPMKALAKQQVTPTQFKGRSLDPKPTIKNMEIAMLHQGRELVQNVVDNKVRDWLMNESGWVVNGEDLFAQTEARARQLAAQGVDLPPGVTIGDMTDSLINANYTAWDPQSLTPLSKGHLIRGNRNVMYVPKWLDKAMNDLYPKSRSTLGGVLDKVNEVFRLSILPFSPRWHVNNVIGGAVMLMAEGGLDVWRHWGAARKLLKTGELPMEISRGAGSIPAADAAWGLATGSELGKILKNEYLRKMQTGGRGIKDGFRKAADVSFHYGEKVDQFYRALAFLEGKTKGDRLGLSPRAARRAGVELANKVLQDWDAMTPIERSVLRMVFPFYGWMKHIVRYTWGLPIDHPARTAILANFARNEIEDWGTGIPERFFQMYVIGKPDINGTVRGDVSLNPFDFRWSGAINMRGTNPFSDVANYMTLAGFVGQLNPVASGFLEAMGINSATGTANLYPETAYNEVLGRNVAKGPNPFVSILRNVIPQTDFVLDKIGMTPSELRNLKITDPDLYNQRIISSIGIPFIPRDLNLQREAALAEIARNKDATNALSRALRTGDWGPAMQYPSIRPLLSVLAAQPRSAIEPFLIGQRPKLPAA